MSHTSFRVRNYFVSCIEEAAYLMYDVFLCVTLVEGRLVKLKLENMLFFFRK